MRPKREPDVETRGFKLWKGEKAEDYGGALLTVNYDDGEEMHESRSYNSPFCGHSLLIMAKRKGEQYWMAMKGKRPDGATFITTKVKGPLTMEEYQEELGKFERNFGFLFDTANPLVTPGRHYNLYFRRSKEVKRWK